MSKLRFGLLAIAAGFMFQGVAVQPAAALTVHKPAVAEKSGVTLARHRHGGVRHFSGGRRHGIYGGGFRRHGFYGGGHRFHRRHFYRPHIYIAPTYGYYNSCRWLKRKALYTGSHYWWRRYQHCRRGW